MAVFPVHQWNTTAVVRRGPGSGVHCLASDAEWIVHIRGPAPSLVSITLPDVPGLRGYWFNPANRATVPAELTVSEPRAAATAHGADRVVHKMVPPNTWSNDMVLHISTATNDV
eukprot:m.835149 g.835149  ORF g.835149 m.835149 type:complete len:114 (+) comp23452_c0_seq20:3204-3545(+)